MSFEVDIRNAFDVGYIRVIGPYPDVIGPGFERLIAWAQQHQISGEYYALYWDNPDVTPAEALKTDVAVTIQTPELVQGDVCVQTVPVGLYASKFVRIENHDFEGAWRQFFAELALSEFQFRPETACMERYLNDGREDDVWDIEMIIPVQPIQA